MIGFAILLKNIHKVEKLKRVHVYTLSFSLHSWKRLWQSWHVSLNVWWVCVCCCSVCACMCVRISVWSYWNICREQEGSQEPVLSYSVFACLYNYVLCVCTCTSASLCLYACWHAMYLCLQTSVYIIWLIGWLAILPAQLEHIWRSRTPLLSSAAINTSASCTETQQCRPVCLCFCDRAKQASVSTTQQRKASCPEQEKAKVAARAKSRRLSGSSQ